MSCSYTYVLFFSSSSLVLPGVSTYKQETGLPLKFSRCLFSNTLPHPPFAASGRRTTHTRPGGPSDSSRVYVSSVSIRHLSFVCPLPTSPLLDSGFPGRNGVDGVVGTGWTRFRRRSTNNSKTRAKASKSYRVTFRR